MSTPKRTTFTVLAAALLIFCQNTLAQPHSETHSLFNGTDLTGWHTDVPAADNDPDIRPSFIVRDGETGSMVVSMGTPNGHLISDAIYENYRLDVEYRFVNDAGNCGVLVNASTPRALYAMFPASIEVQMHRDNAGDFWCIAENIAVNDMAEHRGGPESNWGGGPKNSRRITNFTDGSESPVGEWNRMVIETLGDKLRVWVNGDLVNDGFDCTASRGQIALQAEGVEVEFRRVDMTPITELSPREDRNDWPSEASAYAPPSQLPPVKVFILAGQSNMEGKAQLKLLDHQITAPATKAMFAHLHNNGEYIVRDDAFINYLNRHGPLTVGYGSPNRFGAELEFGNTMADHFDEPVVLIKAAWGGKSLYRDFRPPSAGLPSTETLEAILTKANENNTKNNRPLITMDDVKASYGKYYRDMLSEVHNTLANLSKRFGPLENHGEARGYEIVGFVWFQGWNDQYNGAETEYESNMEHFINDIRRDLGVPNLPVVIGVMGQNGSTPAKGAMLAIQNAQVAMETMPDFVGNVLAVRTDALVDIAAENLIDGWQDHVEEWEKVGSDRGYHYLGSAIWFSRMGTSFADAMLELMGEQQ